MAEPTREERVKNAQDGAIRYLNQDQSECAQVMALLAQSEATMVLAAEQKRIADWLEAWPISHRGFPIMEHWSYSD